MSCQLIKSFGSIKQAAIHMGAIMDILMNNILHGTSYSNRLLVMPDHAPSLHIGLGHIKNSENIIAVDVYVKVVLRHLCLSTQPWVVRL